MRSKFNITLEKVGNKVVHDFHSTIIFFPNISKII